MIRKILPICGVGSLTKWQLIYYLHFIVRNALDFEMGSLLVNGQVATLNYLTRRIELAENRPNYHFFEWLSAVMFYESTGYLSLLENYTAKNHLNKIEKFKEVVSQDVFEFAINNQSGLPDLFCFLPNADDYFFCEVKGGRDRVRSNQDIKIKELEVLTGKNVWVINLRKINS